ncbi:MAG: hypothetical protein K9J37_01455 [Saprospiraceae bacterium]|nr:hypothetical protein [Saprospiraceae bacterium]MCF8248542.1 hypothetical protein [Saprospiraceae bacterium]MCF8280291.1 hypothetical protein [Bacteroidales bacterium]MCF8310276.1 hypothetical protein [Saprospiraceae bacterium]MCF8439285.1 hypothetical protein [Saprospiraceae bacterium]
MPDILDQGLFDETSQPTGDFEFYRDFFNGEQAEAFVELLKENSIPYKLEKSRLLLDAAITGHGLMPFAVLKLRALDFSKVNQLLEEYARNDHHFIDNHYFHDYKASELLDVVQKPDEWTPEDVAVARHFLDKQGVAIPQAQVENFKQQRYETLRAGKKASQSWVVTYLLFVVFGAFLLSPFFIIGGIGMGWYYWQDKTIDSDGNKYFSFDEASRNTGQVIFYLGWVFLLASIFFWAYLPNNIRLF